MPIKYQALGNSGTDLILKAVPNVSVTLSKENYTNTITANENGQALFKNLSNGTYTATAQGSDGTQYQKEILINNVQEESFVVTKVKYLPLKSKIKFSSGETFVLQTKNAETHPANSATLLSEYLVEDFTWEIKSYGNNAYYQNEEWKALFNKYFDALNSYERKSILTFDADNEDENPDTKTPSKFYILSYFELGTDEYGRQLGSSSYAEMFWGRNLGFADDASRIRTYKNGKAGTYWTRSNNQWSDLLSVWKVDETGKVKETGSKSSGTFGSYGVLLACDLSQDTTVYLDSDGYYRVADK